MAAQPGEIHKRDDWNDLISNVNEKLIEPPSGSDCEAKEPFDLTEEFHRWSKQDITEIQNAMKETCKDIRFSELKDRWEHTPIKEINDQLSDIWCDCEPTQCTEVEKTTVFFFQSLGELNDVGTCTEGLGFPRNHLPDRPDNSDLSDAFDEKRSEALRATGDFFEAKGKCCASKKAIPIEQAKLENFQAQLEAEQAKENPDPEEIEELQEFIQEQNEIIEFHNERIAEFCPMVETEYAKANAAAAEATSLALQYQLDFPRGAKFNLYEQIAGLKGTVYTTDCDEPIGQCKLYWKRYFCNDLQTGEICRSFSSRLGFFSPDGTLIPVRFVASAHIGVGVCHCWGSIGTEDACYAEVDQRAGRPPGGGRRRYLCPGAQWEDGKSECGENSIALYRTTAAPFVTSSYAVAIGTAGKLPSKLTDL